ncbi:CPSF A subunit region-domain-containing protein [Gorgonomyces haynaldii]|nr:CPSF A subunit region-domain-containing protein [Gorgonomyces haynaldii]
MHLYNTSLITTQAITHVISGHFSGTKQQEICLGRNNLLELVIVDPQLGKVQTLASVPVFGLIRSLVSFRLVGTLQDYIVVGSDAGRIVILKYDPKTRTLEKIHQETFGKTGARRIVPGQYLAADPHGRAVMIAAVEKQKLTYVMNRDLENKLTISSPLETNRKENMCFTIVGMDVGFENPCFAAIECDVSESDKDTTGEAFEQLEKLLVIYELDLGLNHVVRKWAEPIDRSSHHLIAVPGGKDGPSGVIVCSQDSLTWIHPDYDRVSIQVPKRKGETEKPLITTSVLHKIKKGQTFFCLLQSELGDVFKLTMDIQKSTDGSIGGVNALEIKYFDSLPVAIQMVLLKSGFLFLAAEFGNHVLYQIESLGEDDPEDKIFVPHALQNVQPVDELDSMSPLTDAIVENLLQEDTPQIYALCGRSNRSTFRIVRHGLQVNEIAVSELPGNPSAVWTCKTNQSDQFDQYIVISFKNATIVLSIGETVAEVTDSGFLNTTSTLAIGLVGEDSLVQVHSLGIRQIRSDRRASDWIAPKGVRCLFATVNERQVCVGLSNQEIVYFEMDSLGNLNEFEKRKRFSAQIQALSLPPVPKGRQRSQFMAVACADNTVRLISLDPSNCLEQSSMQALSAVACSLALIEMMDTTTGLMTLFLNMGLVNGVLLRTTVDTVTGELTDARTRYLGPKPVKLVAIEMMGSPAMLALCTRPWLAFSYHSRYRLVPLGYEMLEFGYSFCSEPCPEGFVAVCGKTLRILQIDNLDREFHQTSIPLKYTPRKMVLAHDKFLIIESDHRVSPGGKQDLDPVQFGYKRAPVGSWASCLRLLSIDGQTHDLIELQDNEAFVSICKATFNQYPREVFYCVGSVKSLIFHPRKLECGYISIYRLENNKLQLFQKTQVDGCPLAMCAFQGKLLVGLGQTLRIYELGKKQLLRKSETKNIPVNVVRLETQGNRIICSDGQQSTLYCMYRHYDNQIVIYADDPYPRWMTTSLMLDYDTTIGGDKFGNLFVNRLPLDLSKEMDEDTTGSLSIFERGYLNAAPNKVHNIAYFCQGETITSLSKTTLVQGGRSCVVYTTLLGTIGCLIPLVSKDDYDTLLLLELALRQEIPPLSGRDHLQYRSQYQPVKAVIDGDFLVQFNLLSNVKKRQIGDTLDKTPTEIGKKLDQIRTRSAF